MSKRKSIYVTMLVLISFIVVFSGCAGGSTSTGSTDNAAAGQKSAATTAPDTNKSAAAPDNLKESLAVDVSGLKSSDNQPLLLFADKKAIPPRPDKPEALPEDNAGHWYDYEYLGWNVQKVNIPKSPANGAKGKKIIMVISGDHPYFTAFKAGAQKIADAYGMTLKFTSANWNIDTQSQLVDQAINEKPDLIFVLAVDANGVAPLLRKVNQANIPVIARDAAKGMEYLLTLTGPDDWGQFRLLAKAFAEKMNYEGGYAIIQHQPGMLPFYSRTYSIITELKKIAPKMKLLDKQTTGLTAEKSLQVTADWITRYGTELKGIVSADDSNAQVGINQACKNAKRDDIIRVAAGNSKVGMDSIKSGEVYAITFQSAESEGALPVKLAADYFNGKNVDPVNYVPMHIITKDDVDKFYPPQW